MHSPGGRPILSNFTFSATFVYPPSPLPTYKIVRIRIRVVSIFFVVEQLFSNLFRERERKEKKLDKVNLKFAEIKKIQAGEGRGNSETNTRYYIYEIRRDAIYCMLHAIYLRIKGCLIITFRLGVESSISGARSLCFGACTLGENKGQKKYHRSGRRAEGKPPRNFELAIALRAQIVRFD